MYVSKAQGKVIFACVKYFTCELSDKSSVQKLHMTKCESIAGNLSIIIVKAPVPLMHIQIIIHVSVPASNLCLTSALCTLKQKSEFQSFTTELEHVRCVYIHEKPGYTGDPCTVISCCKSAYACSRSLIRFVSCYQHYCGNMTSFHNLYILKCPRDEIYRGKTTSLCMLHLLSTISVPLDTLNCQEETWKGKFAKECYALVQDVFLALCSLQNFDS